MAHRGPMLRQAIPFLLLLAACDQKTTETAPPAASTTAAVTAAPFASGAPSGTGPKVTDRFATTVGELTVTPIHHATMLLKIGGKSIYLDPVVADASYEGLPKADWVFVTDIHGDHMDPAGLAGVKKDGTVIVAPPAVNEKMPATVVMKNGETHDFGAFKVEAIPMYNLVRGPSAGKLYHDKGRGNGYVFTFGETRVYVSGDTECTPELKALPKIDVAFLCMNLPYTMPPSEAATCIDAFKPKVVFPFHYKGSNLDELSAVHGSSEIRKRAWY